MVGYCDANQTQMAERNKLNLATRCDLLFTEGCDSYRLGFLSFMTVRFLGCGDGGELMMMAMEQWQFSRAYKFTSRARDEERSVRKAQRHSISARDLRKSTSA